jgi:NADH:ubiquinone oxidoreductase subunit 4 (subunit M)
VPIIVLAVLMGILPNLFLRPMAPSVERMLDLVRSEAPSEIRAASPEPRASSPERVASR